MAETGEDSVFEKLPPGPETGWIVQGMGRPIEGAIHQQAGPEAGLDQGRWFYRVAVDEIEVAFREDRKIAYLSRIAPEIKSAGQVTKLLKECSFFEAQIPDMQQIRECLEGDRIRWFPVAEGGAALGEEWTEYRNPREPGKSISAENLAVVSGTLNPVLWAEKLSLSDLSATPALSATPGDVLAQVHKEEKAQAGYDVFGGRLTDEQPLPGRPSLGQFVEAKDDEFLATRYGYVCLLHNTLSVLPPIWVDPIGLEVYWCLMDHHPKVSREMIQSWLEELEVVEGIEEEEIGKLLSLQAEGKHERGGYLIASGTAKKGKDSELKILVDTAVREGKQNTDGSREFTPANIGPNVKPDQVVVRVTPPGSGIPGKDVRGNEVPAIDGDERKLEAGENVRVETKDGVASYSSTIEGSLKVTDDKVSVYELLTIDGDVGFGTGNLDFRGEVCVVGSVKQTFSVKAAGDVTITGAVESGAKVFSHGNVTTGEGILGRKTTVMALGDVRTQFVKEAKVQSGRDIILGSHADDALLRAGGIIIARRALGLRGGTIWGGQSWAMRGIDAHFAGTLAGTRTSLNAGMDLEHGRKLEKLQQNIQKGNKQILQHLGKFGLPRLDVAQIQKMLAATTGPQRKILALSAQQLGKIVQINQQLLAERKELELQVYRWRTASIVVWSTAFQGVTIRIGKHEEKIAKPVKAVRYHVKDDRLLER